MLTRTEDNEKIVIAAALRSPIGQAGKSFSDIESYELGSFVAAEMLKKYNISNDLIDGVVAGEIGQSSKAPNVARVISVKMGLPLQAPAVTVANNCVSGYEAVTEAARRIITGEGSFFLVLGLENMSRYHFYLNGVKNNSKTSTVEKLKSNWSEALNLGVEVVDSVEEGLMDPVRKLNMAMTGEVAAQNYKLSKEILDEYAWNSYKKTHDAILSGKYKNFIVPVKNPSGEVLENDEFIMSKVGMVENKDRFGRASVIFDSKYMSIKEFYDKYSEWIRYPYEEGKTKAAVTLFNACPRSDGAGALIVTTEKLAKKNGLEVLAVIRSWGNYGVDPAHMGIGMAHSMHLAINHAGLDWKDVKGYELHEAFAATAMGSMREVKEKYNFDMEKANTEGLVNPHGGTLAIGHPLGATGIRIIINQIMHIQERKIDNCLGAICAGGGVGGSILLERP